MGMQGLKRRVAMLKDEVEKRRGEMEKDRSAQEPSLHYMDGRVDGIRAVLNMIDDEINGGM